MTDPNRWLRLREHFESIRSLTITQVNKYLETHCSQDEHMRNELLGLVESHHDTASFPPSLNLNELVFGALGDPLYQAGDQIDQYEICGLLNTGGMGDVYLARRTSHYEDELAIKVIRQSIASPAMIERFRRERQTLALLDHPGITRILDGGTTPDELPYFVMEYVRGVSITAFCRENRCDARRRVGLFMAACDAVQCAHQSLVVHRDIKPSNILVTDQGVVKLLDFGIAFVPEEDQGIPDTSAHPITLASSSPEQIRSEPVSTTTDVYSLGVVLYELLAGAAPFQLDGLMRTQAAERICHETPPPPSVLRKKTERDNSEYPAELDAIVLKAMRKDPGDRYQSVAHLREDLSNCLSSYPVDVFATSRRYRIRKLVARNRTSTALLAALAAVLVLAGAITAESLVRTRAAHAESQQQRDDARETIAFLQTMLAQANPYVHDQPMSVEEALRNADALIDTELSDSPTVAAHVRLAVGRIYMDLFMYEQAEPYLDAALVQFTNLQQPVSDATLANCMGLLARARSDLVWTRNVETRDVVEMQERVLEINQKASPPPSREVAISLGDLALAHWAQRPNDPASDRVIELYQRSLEMFDHLGIRSGPSAAENDVGIGHAYSSRAQDSLAERHFRLAITSYERSREPSSPFYLQAVNACAQLLRRTGQPEEASRLFALTIERSPEHMVAAAEIEARWGAILCGAETTAESEQSSALLRLLARQLQMHLQHTPDDAALLATRELIDTAQAHEGPELLRAVWPVMLLHQQEFPRTVPNNIAQVVAAGLHLYGEVWMIETLDHASNSGRLSEQTLGVLSLFRNRLTENATSTEYFSGEVKN